MIKINPNTVKYTKLILTIEEKILNQKVIHMNEASYVKAYIGLVLTRKFININVQALKKSRN